MDTREKRIQFLEEQLKTTQADKDKAKAQAAWTGFCLALITLIGVLIVLKPEWFVALSGL